MMRDHCQFTTQPAASLQLALDGFGALEHWPISETIRWSDAVEQWLPAPPARQTELSVALVAASAANIVVHSPAPDAPSMCEARVEFDAEVELRTSDGVVASSARGRFKVRRPATEAQLRVHMRPAPASSSPGITRSLSLALELPHVGDAPAKVELLGHEQRTGVGASGRSFAAGGSVILGSN